MNKTEKCPLCEVVCQQKYLESHLDQTFNKNFDLFECSKCAVQHWFPMQNPGGEWYERDERYSNRNITPTLIPGLQHVSSMKIMKKRPGSLLDVGCGHGNFINYANKFGFKCVGFDFDRDGIESGKRLFGLEDLTVDTLENYVKVNPGIKYDWVTFFDVFEHVDNHNIFIDDVRKVLKQDGYIAMSIPHRESASWLIIKDLPPRHLTRWNKETIKSYLENKGFVDVKVGFVPATLDFLVTKFRWKYGKYFNFNLVTKLKQKEATQVFLNKQGNTSYISNESGKVKFIKILAKAKDYTLFGIPALLTYFAMLGRKARYTDMYIIAKKV